MRTAFILLYNLLRLSVTQGCDAQNMAFGTCSLKRCRGIVHMQVKDRLHSRVDLSIYQNHGSFNSH